MNNDSEFLTTEDAARLLNVHVNTIIRWIKQGKLPASQIGREYRIPRPSIDNRVNNPVLSTRIIAVANQKGGVAKTTTTLNLAAALAQRDQQVLVVDLDPQGGCAVSLGIAADTLNRTVYDVLMDDEIGFSDIVMPTSHGFHLAPSNIDLAGAEVELKQLLAAEQMLKRNLASSSAHQKARRKISANVTVLGDATGLGFRLVAVATRNPAARRMGSRSRSVDLRR